VRRCKRKTYLILKESKDICGIIVLWKRGFDNINATRDI
jgi:hypothetical protein